jgi:hypothetical protein
MLTLAVKYHTNSDQYNLLLKRPDTTKKAKQSTFTIVKGIEKLPGLKTVWRNSKPFQARQDWTREFLNNKDDLVFVVRHFLAHSKPGFQSRAMSLVGLCL